MRKIFKILLSIGLISFITACSTDKDKDVVGNGINKEVNRKPTGTSANAFLSASNYTSLAIELVYVDGFRPNSASIQNLKTFLEDRLNKPAGISIIEKKISSPGLAPYTNNEVILVEDTFRTLFNNQSILTLYIYFADGGSTSDTSSSMVLGTAYRNTSFVIYEDTILENSDGIGQPSRTDLETVVMLHEMGHLLGLVNLGSTMQNPHLDTSHDKHCDNSDCLMYWEAETGNIFGSIIGGNIPQLDANCIADLQANGGK